MIHHFLSPKLRPFRTIGGIRVPHHKNTAGSESIVMPPPSEVVIPMKQHIGIACNPVVKVGDVVSVGQVIANSEAFLSAPIHASVSGTVKKIDSTELPTGVVESIVIESDGQMRLFDGIKPPKIDSLADLIIAVRESGLVGLGGAGFPAHVKLRLPKGKKIDTLLVNAAECEPYITSDHREAIENSYAVFSGVYLLKELLEIDRVIIAVEDNKPDVIKVLEQIADSKTYDPDDAVRVLTLTSRYPQGAEKVLIRACTGRRIPDGKLPADIGCLVMNVTSVAFLSDYIRTGIPLVKKRITIDGTAVKNPQNVIVPLGTRISDVIAFCGGYQKPAKKILMGGPMMGLALTDDSLSILKQNNAIIAFAEKEAKLPKPTACIRCGRCAEVCPMGLLPARLEKQANFKNVESLKRLGVASCMECGCCAYNCPAHRQLVQAIRMGKTIVKTNGKG